MTSDEKIANESETVKYVDELLWVLEDVKRVADGKAHASVLKDIVDSLSDDLPEWLENLKHMDCDMCGKSNDSVGFSGCDHPEHSTTKICKQCDIDGQDYNGWCDE